MLGILGGMGPRASAAFLDTLYRLNVAEREQDGPACVLLSDPSIPDRTEAILAGDVAEVAARIDRGLAQLAAAGATKIVIACVTAHAVLGQVPEARRRLVVPILDLAIAEVLATGRPHLLLATRGTRRARIFESLPRWPEVSGLIRWPDDDDQRRIHEIPYRLKRAEPDEAMLDGIGDLARRSGTEDLLFGCSELHLLHRALARRISDGGDGGAVPRVVDPLWIAARDVRRLAG